MSETALVPSKAKSLTKKEIKKQITEKLEGALVDYKSSFSKKEFGEKLKKATKMFAETISRDAKKKEPAIKPVKVKSEKAKK